MTTSFPTSIQTLSGTRGTSGQPLNAPNHVTQHTYEDDTIEALEAKVGIDGSAVTTSFDYKLSGVTGTDKAVSKTGTEVLTNKTLTSPKITAGTMAKGDMLQLSASDGTLTYLRASADGNIPSWDNASSQWIAIANPAAADASTTVKGVVEIATQAEADAGTANGGTSALLVARNSNVRARLLNTGVVDTGAANAYAIAPMPAITAYADYQEFTFKAVNTNTTSSTLAVNGLSTISLRRSDGSTLLAGDVVTGNIIKVVYIGGVFQIVSPRASSFLSLYANGTTTKNSADASTTQNIAHGLGIIPKKIKLQFNATTAGVSLVQFSTAVYNGTTQSAISCWGPSGGSMVTDASFSLNVTNNDAAARNLGVITFDATNIIITWTKTNSPAGTYQVLWEAEA